MSLSTYLGTCRICLFYRLSQKFPKNARSGYKHTQVPIKPNRFKTYRELHGSIESDINAKDFVYALNPRERTLLLTELEKFKNEQDPGLTIDPPTQEQLKLVTLHSTLPFIGFGFLDNFLMIIAGEYIESTFGLYFGISTMAAAALGNWVSDVAGIGSAHYVEVLASKFGLKSPSLSAAQVDMKQTRWASNIGKALGITIGCFLGMLPLLFYEPPKQAKIKEETDKS
ncbi:hypothetical protein CHS0354_010875 [Potamilus streckersoni]|uniref:Transmembrane protein 65 n=1 Tax=Potamilus streckersoni TaxID=2493646 RepID=A0AAE0SND6_9BIVA|nr:hypothetical protein CHS0354_010875 [Potamilus streckersoni]